MMETFSKARDGVLIVLLYSPACIGRGVDF